MANESLIGARTASLRAREVVTGKAQYAGDLNFPGMLVGKLLYAEDAPARIRSIDVEPARAIPGVIAVLTHKDIPGENSYLYSYLADQPLLVSDQARYRGDAIAAVAAVDERTAEAALGSIRVDHDPLPGVFDLQEAIDAHAPRVWPDRPNVAERLVIEHGDADRGFAQADLIIENDYSTHWVEHAFLETEVAVARPLQGGGVVVYASCQAPHRDRRQIARSLDLPENEVRVITPRIGGAFGGKDEAHVQIHAALLAQATGRPVRIQRSRRESIRTHVKRVPTEIHYRTGATREGRITAVEVQAIGDAGPYLNASGEIMGVLAATCFGPYEVPNARIEALTVLTNNPITGAMRGFGIPQGTFAYERQMDTLAEELGMDPYEIRRINALDTGTTLPTGAVVREGRGMKAALSRAADLAGWFDRDSKSRRPAPHLRRGWGMASNLFTTGLGRNVPDFASAQLDMASDGSVILRTGAADMGQGSHTSLALIAAQALGVEFDQVKVIPPDTDVTGDAGSTVASRQTFVSGNAVLRAAEKLKQTLIDVAAAESGLDASLLSLQDGILCAQGEQLSIRVGDLAAKAVAENKPLQAEGFYAMEYPEAMPEDAYAYAHGVFTYATQIAQVLVDLQTGEVSVEDYVAVHDAGRIINRGGAEGQIQGGVTMGLGYALMEALVVDEGEIQNASLEGYLIPTSLDRPPLRSETVEIPEPFAPYGAKGLGESPLAPVAPAIANAVSDALGVPLNDLPLSPERVLRAISERKQP